MAMSNPAPIAAPLMAAMMGLSKSSKGEDNSVYSFPEKFFHIPRPKSSFSHFPNIPSGAKGIALSCHNNNSLHCDLPWLPRQTDARGLAFQG